MNHIMPDGGSGVDKSGGISVKRSIFAPGWVVGGVLPDDQVSEDRHMLSTQAATVRCARLHVVPEPPITPDFWECDQLGVKPTPKCDRCRKCQLAGECSESHAQHTLKDQAELDLIRKNTKLVNGEILAKGNFKIKAMTYSGDTDQEEIDKLGGNIFGYEWNVSQDVLGVKFPVKLNWHKMSVRS